jgi:hypothetical protein
MSKVPRILLGSLIAAAITGSLLGIAVARLADLWPGWFVIGAVLVFGLLFNLADIVIGLIDGRSRRADTM